MLFVCCMCAFDAAAKTLQIVNLRRHVKIRMIYGLREVVLGV